MSTPKTAFVVSPISTPGTAEHKHSKYVLDYIIRKALTTPEWEVIRADEETSPDSISTQVIERVIESDLVVAVLTDQNPNVFYELAVAHGNKKPVVHLLQEGQRMPFDVGDQRAIFYELSDPASVDIAIKALADSVTWAMANPGKVRNPLTAYARFTAISEAKGAGDAGSAVAEALEEVSRRLSRLETGSRSVPARISAPSRHGEILKGIDVLPSQEFLLSMLSPRLRDKIVTASYSDRAKGEQVRVKLWLADGAGLTQEDQVEIGETATALDLHVEVVTTANERIQMVAPRPRV